MKNDYKIKIFWFKIKSKKYKDKMIKFNNYWKRMIHLHNKSYN